MTTFLLTTKQINDLKKQWQDSLFSSDNQYIDCIVKNEFLLINIYKSQKVVVNKASEEILDQLKKWEMINQKNHFFNHDHIGSDEVGTGDFFGPIVVCAAFFKQKQMEEILKIGVKDSKLLNDEKIKQMAPLLMEKVAYKILVLNNEKYNEIIKKENLNAIKAKLHNQAIKLLLQKVNTKNIIIDQFTTKKSFYNYFANQDEIVKNLQFFTKAESKYLGVAIASIIARYCFLNEIIKISTLTKVNIPLGASPIKINPVLKMFDEKKLKKIAKLNFKNYKK